MITTSQTFIIWGLYIILHSQQLWSVIAESWSVSIGIPWPNCFGWSWTSWSGDQILSKSKGCFTFHCSFTLPDFTRLAIKEKKLPFTWWLRQLSNIFSPSLSSPSSKAPGTRKHLITDPEYKLPEYDFTTIEEKHEIVDAKEVIYKLVLTLMANE